MSITIEMPKLSDTQTEGVLVKWHKSPGDTVEVGDVLAEVETDKAVMEMEAFDDGIMGEIIVQEGESAEIGAPLATLLEEGEDAESTSSDKSKKSDDEDKKEEKEEAEKDNDGDDDAPIEGDISLGGEMPDEDSQEESSSQKKKPSSESPQKAAASSEGRIKSSPYARKLADEKNVDITQLTGSGPDGRIVASDVEAAAKQGSGARASFPAPEKVLLQEGDERIPLSGMRRVIADRLQSSKQLIPHFYLEADLDVANLLSVRSRLNANAEKAGRSKITINDFVLFATARAIAKVPAINASFDGDAIVQHKGIQLAVAVALDEGLITPVIREAQDQSLSQISAAVRDLAGRARSKKLAPAEYQGGTFTVSNLGSYGVDRFFAIINPPQAAILSVGSIVKKPVVDENGQIVVGQRMTVGLSADHRVVDGAIGAQFLQALRDLIENPFGLVL